MRKGIIYIALFSFFALVSFTSTEPLFHVPSGWPKPSYDFSKNTLSQDKINIGRALFYSPILSKDNTISCASCHLSFTGFAHTDHDLSHGIDGKIGKRNAPALMNLAWGKTFMWDGRINHLDMQALAPISDSNEMNENIAHVVEKLNQSNLFKNLFYSAYRDSLITGERTLKCITQFMLTLVSANSKYDQVMRHEDTFSSQEKNGYLLFQKNCASCHTEPLFTNNQFANNGLQMDTVLLDNGRFAITHLASDSLTFKVPTLRNIEFTYPYMHDGRFKKLSQVLNHYTSIPQHASTLDSQLQKPIQLSANDKVDVISFLLTLTDKEFLYHPKFQYPKKLFSQSPNGL